MWYIFRGMNYATFILVFMCLLLAGLLVFVVVSGRKERAELMDRLMARDFGEFQRAHRRPVEVVEGSRARMSDEEMAAEEATRLKGK